MKFKIGDKVRYKYNPNISGTSRDLDGEEGIIFEIIGDGENPYIGYTITKNSSSDIRDGRDQVGKKTHYSANRFVLVEKKKNPTYKEILEKM